MTSTVLSPISLSAIIMPAIILSIGHWFADFICQSNWQANNKWNNVNALAAHCWWYTIIITICFGVSSIFMKSPMTLAIVLGVTNGVMHFAIDFVTSKMTHHTYLAKQYHWFFVIIGADQLLHTLLIIMSWIIMAIFITG